MAQRAGPLSELTKSEINIQKCGHRVFSLWVYPLVTLLQKPRAFNIITSLIPSDYTGLLQPFDTAVYRPFKVYLDFMNAYIGDKENRGEDVDSWSVSDKRIMATHVIAEA